MIISQGLGRAGPGRGGDDSGRVGEGDSQGRAGSGLARVRESGQEGELGLGSPGSG